MAYSTHNCACGKITKPLAAILISGLGLMSLASTGCSPKGSNPQATKKPPLVAKVTIDYANASPEEVDATVFPVLQQNAPAISHACTITCIARSGAFEAYVQANPDANATELENQLTSALLAGDLPAGTSTPVICFIKTGVPKVIPKAIPTINLELNHGRLKALGLTAADVHKRVSRVFAQHAADGNAGEALRSMTVETAQGLHVPLANIATARMESRPDCIIRKIQSP